MAGWLSLPYILALVYFGAAGYSWWIIFPAAIVGAVLYIFMRRIALVHDIKRDNFATMAAIHYTAQVITASIIFGIGVAIGVAFE